MPRVYTPHKEVVAEAEAAHEAWLRTLGAVLKRHRALQEQDKANGLKPRPDTDEVKAAWKTLQEWGLI